MKRIYLSIIAFCMLAFPYLHAVPAKPGPIKVTLPDGTVTTIFLHGDEFFHWMTDSKGTVVEWTPDSYLRPATLDESAREEGRQKRRQSIAELPSRAQRTVKGTQRIPVFLIQFKDKSFSIDNPQEAFDKLLNEEDYNFNGATGSARDFYLDNSNNLYNPVFDVFAPVTADESYLLTLPDGTDESYSTKASRILRNALRQLNPSIDYSLYDNDNDGQIDMVLMYYAGYSQAEGTPHTIWPHRSSSGLNITLDGVVARQYFCTAELRGVSGTTQCGIGPTVHEFGHALGLPDFYDADYAQNGQCHAMAKYSTMASGSYLNDSKTPPYFTHIEREKLGWAQAPAFITKGGPVTIPPFCQDDALQLATSMDGEAFYLECRAKAKWDFYLPSHGLLIYHIDQSNRRLTGVTCKYRWDYWPYYNDLNDYASHPLCYVITAQDQDNVNYTAYDQRTFPGPWKITSYHAIDWDGVESDFVLEDITFENDVISMNVRELSSSLAQMGFNSIDDPNGGSYKAGNIFYFNLLETETHKPVSVSWRYDGATASKSVTLTAGTHLVQAILGYDDGSKETLELEINVTK